MRIRQIALVAADLDAALADLTDVLGIDVGFHDDGVAVFGLRNGVMPVGEHFLEVVSPKQDGTSAGRYLARRRGDGGYMVIFQTHDLARRRRHFASQGVRVAWEIALDHIETAHLHPRDTGGAIVSVDEARPWESWRWAGPSWREHVRTGRATAIAGVEIQSDDPDALAQKWSRLFEMPLADGSRTLETECGETIEFSKASDDRGEGIRSVYLRAADPEAIRSAAQARGFEVDADGAVTLVGTRFVPV
jgi:catechol 2,3-dioxygenase-like lactoylglutathione lyase family enzyme